MHHAASSDGNNGLSYSISLLSIMLFTSLGAVILRPVIDLNLNAAGHSKTYIGSNGVMWELGCFLGALGFVYMLRRWGIRTVLWACLSVLCFLVLSIPHVLFSALLFPVRFGVGLMTAIVCLTCITGVVVESGKGNHATALCVVTVAATGAKAFGSAMVRFVGVDGYTPFLLAAMSMGVGVLLVGSIRPGAALNRPKPKAFPIIRKGLPTMAGGALLLLAFCAGACRTSFLTFLPIYAVDTGFTPGDGALLLAGAFAGAVVLSIPIGRIGDRSGHRRTLILISITVSVVSTSLLLGELPLAVFLTAVFLMGGMFAAMRDLGLAAWSSKHPEPENVIAWCSFWAGVGAVVGILGTGVLMDFFGPPALVWVMMGGSLLILLMAFTADPSGLEVDEDTVRERDALFGADKILLED
jgi:predicted MFS family arabinose efflux permease